MENLFTSLIPNLIKSLFKKKRSDLSVKINNTNTNNYAQVIKLNPKDAKAYFNRENEEYDLEEEKDEDYIQVIKSNPKLAKAYDKESYFNINPSLTVSSLSNNFKNDERSVYVVFHAMFTYTQILKTLDRYYSKKYGEQKQLKETIGRICFYLSKFKGDIDCFSTITKYNTSKSILTKKSERFFNEFIETFNIYREKWNEYINKVNLSRQPYNFDYKVFELLNKNIKT